jgi:hypothetical protein
VNAGRRPIRLLVVLSATLAACASIPSITFTGDEADGGLRDATVANPEDSGGTAGGDGGDVGAGGDAGGGGGPDAGRDATSPKPDAGGSDAGVDSAAEASADGGVDASGDDAADAGPTTKCGNTLVQSCVSCPGMPLHCKKAARDDCVADCTGCGTDFLPCVHCDTPTSAPYGTCVPVQANGEINCPRNNLCACNVDTDCLAIAGSAQTCDVVSAKKVGCLTCGADTTAGLPCVSEAGAGTCEIVEGGVPTCQ